MMKEDAREFNRFVPRLVVALSLLTTSAMAADPPDHGDVRPIPDPTELTTEQLLREIGHVQKRFDTRLDAMDKAIDLLQKFADKSPTTAAVAQSVESLEKLTTERFQSTEKAMDTSGKSLIKQIDAQGTNIGTLTNGLSGKIDDIKDRLNVIEGHSKGIGDTWGYVVAAAGLLVAVVALFFRK